MKEYIFKLLEDQGGFSPEDIAANVIAAAAIGFFIFISYYISHRGTIYSKKFNVSLVVLTVLTATVMTVIGNNIALSLGMVGALSIVRFRTVVKDTRDTVYIFWTIVAGICCGVGDYRVAIIGSIAVFIILLIFGGIKSDRRMLLIIRGDRSAESAVQSLVYRFFERKAVMRVKNTTEKSIEFIYEISDKVLRKAEKDNSGICDALYALGNIEYANLVMQNDEISS
ncbi:MAG: DUF4956 domain-containing protein [Anaerovoracaceae bacterium]|nr:DUF4956 domain-containing protein [Bacillota bacterium]